MKTNLTMKTKIKKPLTLMEKAQISSGRTMICSTCIFRGMMDINPGCKQCTKHYVEAYQKGYKQALRDLKNKK